MNHRIRNAVIAFILAAGIVVPVWLWMHPSSPETLVSRAIPLSTPVSGRLAVAVDRSLMPVAELQAQVFSERYPKASITLSEGAGQPVRQLLRHQAGAAIIEGRLSNREDSLMASLEHPVKRQPVARNALVFIVNRANPVRSIDLEAMKRLFSGTVTDWSALGGERGRIVVCLDGSDQRARVLLAEMLFGKQETLKATAESDRHRLLDRIRDDRQAAAVITLPAYAEALRSGGYDAIRAVPVSASAGSAAVNATSETIYNGNYPLSTVVFYLYDPYDPLATGFGAWLAKEGQKLFERGDMAPYEQLVRTIMLK